MIPCVGQLNAFMELKVDTGMVHSAGSVNNVKGVRSRNGLVQSYFTFSQSGVSIHANVRLHHAYYQGQVLIHEFIPLL
jgi:hypothetical protein